MKAFTQFVTFFILGSIQTLAFAETNTIEKITEPSSINWASPKSIKEHMVYKLVPVKGESTFAPNVALSDPTLAKNFSEIYIVRSENFEDGESFTLFVTASYTDSEWRNYSKATTAKDDVLDISTLKKTEMGCDNKGSCNYEEQLAISLGFLEVVDSMSTHLELILGNNSLDNTSSSNKRVDHIKIPGSYFLAIMRTLRAE
jgi:hypothetical protein